MCQPLSSVLAIHLGGIWELVKLLFSYILSRQRINKGQDSCVRWWGAAEKQGDIEPWGGGQGWLQFHLETSLMRSSWSKDLKSKAVVEGIVITGKENRKCKERSPWDCSAGDTEGPWEEPWEPWSPDPHGHHRHHQEIQENCQWSGGVQTPGEKPSGMCDSLGLQGSPLH